MPKLSELALRLYLDMQRTLRGDSRHPRAADRRWITPSSAEGERLGRWYGISAPLLVLALLIAGFAVWQAIVGALLLAFAGCWLHLAAWNAVRALRR
jgi:hypothetical protein